MQEHAKERPVFLCGNSIKGDDIWQTFDKVLYLNLDESTLRQRVAARTDNDFGQSEDELRDIFRRQSDMDAAFTGTDAVVIDAAQSIDKLVGIISAA